MKMKIDLHTQTMDILMQYCKKYHQRPHRVCNELLDKYMEEFIENKMKTHSGDKYEKQYKQ